MNPSSTEHAQWMRGQEGYKAKRTRRRSWRLPEDPPLPCNKCVMRKIKFCCLVNFYSLWGRGVGDCENRLKVARLVLADLVSLWAHNAPWLDLDDPSSCLVEKNSYVIWISLFIVGLFYKIFVYFGILRWFLVCLGEGREALDLFWVVFTVVRLIFLKMLRQCRWSCFMVWYCE